MSDSKFKNRTCAIRFLHDLQPHLLPFHFFLSLLDADIFSNCFNQLGNLSFGTMYTFNCFIDPSKMLKALVSDSS